MSDESGIAIPTGWFKARASEVCAKIQDGTHFSPKAQLTTGQYPYVTAKNVRPSGLDLRDITYLSEQDHREIYARCDCRKGDVLLVKDGVNTGDAAINSFDGEISLLSSVCMLRPRAEVLDAGFLRYYLQSPQCTPFLLGGMTGTAIRRIILKRIKALPVLACAIPEQHAIVAAIDSHFSRLDAATATLERVQRNLERYRASVLKAAVEGRLVPTESELAKKEGRSYEPASVLLKRILAERRRRWEEAELAKLKAKGKVPIDDRWKARYEEPAAPDTDGLPELPEGWCWSSLEQLLSHLTSGSRDWTDYYDRGTGVFLMAQNVRPGRLDLSFVQHVDPPLDDASCARSQVEEGDLLVTIVGANAGDVCRIPGPLPEHYVCQSVALMRPALRSLSRYLDAYLNSPPGQAVFDRFMYGQGRPHLGFDQLETTPVPLPPPDEAERIVDLVDDKISVATAVAAPIGANKSRIARLRQSILKWAFEGRLVGAGSADEGGRERSARDAGRVHPKPNLTP